MNCGKSEEGKQGKGVRDKRELIWLVRMRPKVLVGYNSGTSVSDIIRNSDKLHTLYIHLISTIMMMSNNMSNFTLIILLLYCVVIPQMCIVYL